MYLYVLPGIQRGAAYCHNCQLSITVRRQYHSAKNFDYRMEER